MTPDEALAETISWQQRYAFIITHDALGIHLNDISCVITHKSTYYHINYHGHTVPKIHIKISHIKGCLIEIMP